MNDSRTQEERDNEPESTVTYSGTHKKDTKSPDSIHSKEEANYKESGVEEQLENLYLDVMYSYDKEKGMRILKQALNKAKEEGRRELLQELRCPECEGTSERSTPSDCSPCNDCDGTGFLLENIWIDY